MTRVTSTQEGWTPNYYEYDGLSSRVARKDSEGTSYFTWDGINVVAERDAEGELTERQVHGYAPIVSVGDIAGMTRATKVGPQQKRQGWPSL